jgi:hypothetical protein
MTEISVDTPDVEPESPAPIVVAPIIVTDTGGDDGANDELERIRAELAAEHERAESLAMELGVIAGANAERERAELEAAEEAARLAAESEAALPEPESNIPEDEPGDSADLEPRFWEGSSTKDYWLPSVD